jgi:hypothetical protein
LKSAVIDLGSIGFLRTVIMIELSEYQLLPIFIVLAVLPRRRDATARTKRKQTGELQSKGAHS